MKTKMLSVSMLGRTFGDTIAVDGVSFDVQVNEIVGLLGPNGAGKTTTINMILGVLEPSVGNILIDDIYITAFRKEGGKQKSFFHWLASRRQILASRSQALERTNFAAVYAPLPGNLTVRQNLRIFGLIYGVKDLPARIQELLLQFDLKGFENVKCGLLSSGEQTRVGLAKALLNRPNLLLLDEPTASLDPATARDIRIKLREYCQQNPVGVLWTSHNMQEVQEVCRRVLFLSRGKILLEGDPRTLPAEHGKDTLEDLFIAVAREPLTLGKVPA
jgi:ABC-2 type transport system ATP-binding protein